MERITGFEPVPTAWKAVMLPLHHIRMNGSLGISTTGVQESRLYRCGPLFILADSCQSRCRPSHGLPRRPASRSAYFKCFIHYTEQILKIKF